MKVILLGPPGAGKGTQADRIAGKLGVSRASSGDLFRKVRQEDTDLGRLVRSYYDRGALVPDDVTIRMIMSWVNAPEQEKGFVLDGFPRTQPQAEALDRELADRGGVDIALYINVSQAELVRRLSSRLVCRKCQTTYNRISSPPKVPGVCDVCGGEVYQREDDKPEVVQKRIEVYMQETAPLVDYYRRQGKLVEVSGEGTIQEVGKKLLAAVN